MVDTENNPVESIKIKHLYENNTIPVLDETTVSVAPSQVELGKEATMILEYTFKNKVLLSETSTETKIYADSYLKSISASQPNLFKFKTSELTKTEYGELVLRLGIGRDHPAANGTFVFPRVYFNDTELVVPTDWRGYDQKTRDRFFGVLEIPVPYELIDTKLTPDNIVKVVFSDGGGHISSAVLQTFDFSTNIRENATAIGENQDKTILIKTTSNACPGAKKGIITISPLLSEVFSVTIKGNGMNATFDFSSEFNIENLPSGNYNLVITRLDVPEFREEYNIYISEPEILFVKPEINESRKEVKLIFEGGEIYIVSLNDEELMIQNNEILLKLNNGTNKVIVKTDKACQGVFTENIFFGSGIISYPNPFSDNIKIDLGMDSSDYAMVRIFTPDGKMLFKNEEKATSRIINLNTSFLNLGVYILAVQTKSSVKNFKIIKNY